MAPSGLSRPSSTEQAQRNGHGIPAASQDDTLHLSANMTLGEAARTVFAFHFAKMLENEAGTRAGNAPEALHDMRVATRRLRAAMRDFRSAFDGAMLEPFVDDIRWIAHLLGSLRDLDVFIEWLEEYKKKAPPVEGPLVDDVIRDRTGQRAQDRAALVAALDSPRYEEFKKRFADFTQNPLPSAKSKDQSRAFPLLKLGRRKILKQDKRVLAKRKGVNLHHLKRLHRARIEFKRLRYTCEFFASLYPSGLSKIIKASTHMQDSLGVVHDADVQSAFLKQMRCARADDAALSQTLDQMIRSLQDQEKECYREFKKEFRRFRSAKFQSKIKKRLR